MNALQIGDRLNDYRIESLAAQSGMACIYRATDLRNSQLVAIFGLLTIHGIAKAAYRAYELLHHVGKQLLQVDGSHATVDVWAIRGDHDVTILLTNYALPRHPIEDQSVRVILKNAGEGAKATIERIDQVHANAKCKWQEMGAPEYLNSEALAELHTSSGLHSEVQACRYRGHALELDIMLPPLAVAAISVRFPEHMRG